jgi:peptidyl-prolyl cis-trans isomerase B (cyclophilin B)
MARTPVPDSATSQFFINHTDNAFLDYRGPQPQLIGYAVFGKVIEGMDVVDKIAAVKTTHAGEHEALPITPASSNPYKSLIPKHETEKSKCSQQP